MKRKNATRTALFTSIISLLLCVSMLVGTTFAWFTDEVQSGRNTIAAGNLDVELYHGKTTEFTDDDKVKGDTVLFDDVAPNLWEPGALAYENLQVANVGSLALQYTLTLDVLNETVVNGYKLSDVIMVGVVEKGVTATTREDIIEAVNGNWTALKNFKLDQTAVKLEAGHATDAFGVVLYWAPNDNEVDNRYNMNNENRGEVLKLDIGVTLTATQVMHENDSFGDDYDGEATPWIGAVNTDWYFANPDAAEFTINTVDELAGLAAIVNGTAVAPVTTYAAEGESETVQNSFAGKTVKLGDNIDLANATWTPIGNGTYAFQGTFDGQDKTISNLKVTGNGSNVGLFGNTKSGAIKNLTVENATVTGRLNVGVVSGQPYTSTYSNITVKGHVEVNGMSYVGGVGGKNAYANWDNITVNVDETSYVKANSVEKGTPYRTYVGGVVGFNGEGGHSFTNISSNIDVYGSTCDVGGAFGIAHYGNKFENVTVTGDVTITNAAEAADAEEMGGIAGVWNNGGSDVTFKNCSFSGTLTANITEGVDLSNNTITGKPYGTGNGQLIIDGNVAFVVASDAAALKDALKNGAENIDANGANLGNLNYGLNTTTVPAGKTVTISNATFEGKSYGNAVDGTVIFENCTFTNTGAYSIHFDAGEGDVIFKNCTLYGWNSFGSTLNSVSFYNCTLYGNGTYALIRSYVDLHVENCRIDTTNANHDDDYSEGVEAVNGATLTERNNTYVVSTAAALQAAIVNGAKVVLGTDITVDKWIMFSETLTLSGQIITVPMNGLTIDGNGHTLTVNSIESGKNGDNLFHDASNLNISDLTIKYADGVAGGSIGLKSGIISNVNFVGGDVAVFPGNGDIKIENCTFATNGTAIYFEEERDNLTVTGCTFNQPDGTNVILLRGDVEFTNNTVNSGRTVNIVSGSPVVTGNNFNNVRLKVYSVATATVSNNTINNLEFENNTYSSTFENNTLSAEAQTTLNAVTKN